MAGRSSEQRELAAVRGELERWRRGFGGRGRRIPERLWRRATGVAVQWGTAETARALRLDVTRLAERVVAAGGDEAAATGRFVEIDAAEMGSALSSTVEVASARGDRMRVVVAGPLEVAAVVRAFLGEG
jgi:hypothetical protein